ncbi:MAG: hypothetical protein K2X11_08055, partial [Acetobacteraceae bacterium]|nr:hypothetical protein [Acetobacteraceae bacterium]
VGQPVAALAAHPAVGPRLRRMAAGRQRVVSDALRGPEGAPIAEAGPWLQGWAATEEARCLLGFDTHTENVVIMLLEGGRPSLFIPPRFAPWPEPLREAIRGFAPELYPTMRFG